MAMELRQELTLKLTQQLVMTPQLQLSIKLLQLSRLELLDYVKEELQQNPVLEEVSEITVSEKAETDEAGREKKEETEVRVEGGVEEGGKEEGIYDYLVDTPSDNYSHSLSRWKEREFPSVETYLSAETTLVDHLLWQLHLSRLNPTELEIGEFIIGNLDEDGYLKVALSEIAQEFNIEGEMAAKVLEKIQEFDPLGVAARDLKECLLIQADFLSLPNTIVKEIIKGYLSYLENKDYQGMAEKLEIPYDTVLEAVKVILELEPKPGRAYNPADVQYVVPDVYIDESDGDFVVLLNDDGLPKLRISHHYRMMLRENNDLSIDTKEYLKKRLRSALWLIKSIHQRQKTLLKISQSIVRFQMDFLKKGIGYLKPLILKDVADDVGVHESTVSRVTTNKYAYTPQGIFELKYFFNKGISNINGDSIASETIKDRIKKIVASEDPYRPLTDEAIVRVLRRSNIDIARRTVAKYRELTGLLPSSKRRKHP